MANVTKENKVDTRDAEFGPETQRGGGEIIKLEVGQVLRGTLTDYQKVTTEVNEESELVTLLDDEDGKLKSLWVSTVLRSRLAGSPMGSRVRIERTADVAPKKKGFAPTKMYRVNVIPPETQG